MINKYYTILSIILLLITGCYNQVEILNGDGSNGNGSNGNGAYNSDIVQATMRAAGDVDNALKQTFFSPAIATNGGSLTYTWNFDDGTVETTQNNMITHTYEKYGKVYKAELKLENSLSSTQKYAYLDIMLDKPQIFMSCDTNGLKMFCKPLISESSINDASYIWEIYDSSNSLLSTINTTGDASADYTFAQSGQYKVILKAQSSKVEGYMTAENQIFVSDKINQGNITYNVLSEDKLTYEYLFNATSSTGALEYCWDFDGTSQCAEGVGFADSIRTTYGIMNHTYEMYEEYRIVTAYARLKSNTSEVVSKKIIFSQELPVVTINATGIDYDRNFTPSFSFIPKGNLVYIWDVGDTTEYSTENVSHTYSEPGLYEVNLNVISDKFSSSIESIKAEPVVVQISSNIRNLVIDANIIKQEQSGETYSFSSPVYTTAGKLYYIWKINNQIVQEGEDLASIQYKFEKYGEDNSVSLEVIHLSTGEKGAAEPIAVKTSTPWVKLYPPQSVIKGINYTFTGEVKDRNTDIDFTPILLNPKYELDIVDSIAGYSLLEEKSSITLNHTFNTTGTKTVKLKVTADNLVAPVYSDPVSIQVNEVVVTCDFTPGEVNKFSVEASCKLEGSTDTTLQYHLFYRQEIDGEIQTLEKNAQDTAEMTFYMNKPNKLFQYETRDIVINYEIGKDGSFPNTGYINYTYKAVEREMGLVEDILDSFQRVYNQELPTYEDSKLVTYALSQNGYVYSWGKGGYAGHGQTGKDAYILKPRRITSINEEISKMEKIDDKIVYTAKTGSNKYILSSSLPYCITNIQSNIIRIVNGFILTDNNEVYYVGADGNNEKIEAVKVAEIKSQIVKFTPNLTNVVYVSTTDGILYRLTEKNDNNNITYNLEEVTTGVQDYKVRYTLDSSSHVFIVKNDKKVYHKAYLHNETSTGNWDCISGIGAGLDRSAYQTLTPINIGSNVEKLYSYPSSTFINNYLMIAIGEDGAAYRWGCDGTRKNIDKAKLSLPNKLVIPNEKIVEYNVTGNDLWDNFVYIMTDKNNLYDVAEANRDKPLKVSVPNNDVITKIHRWYVKFAEAESGNFYKISWSGNTTINLINNFKNYSSAVVPYYYYGGSYILKDTNNKLFGMGWNDAGGKQYLLGLGDMEFTRDKYGDNYAVPLSIPEAVSHMYTISKNKSSQSNIIVTESGKMYGWGANAGLLPVGHADPVKTPVIISGMPANIKKFLWNEDASLDAQVFTVLTQDGKVYSWGRNNLTGTDSKTNLSPDGYLVVPTLVN